MISPLYSILQLCDSNFPSGAFSHSFGLETYIQEGAIKDKSSFFHALTIYIRKQLVYTDGLSCRLGYEMVERDNFDCLLELDRLLFVSSLAQETRVGNRRMGERIAKLCMELYPSGCLQRYLAWIKEKKAYGHPSLVFAIVLQDLKISKETAVGAYLFSIISSLTQNAVRGIPLGQTDGQKLLIKIQPVIDEAVKTISHLSFEDIGAVSPGLEIAQMRHERLHVRLFMS